MASSSGKKKDKGPEKVYVQDSESDDDGVELSFFDFSQETFKPTLNSCDDPFLNLLCDESLLRSGIDRMRADTSQPESNETEHPHFNEVGVEYRVHDPSMAWDQMRPVLGDYYESTEQLKFALTNYAVKNGYQLYFEKRDRIRVIAKCGKHSQDALPCPFRVAAGWKYNERTFQIKSICETHLCARNYNFGSLVTSTWLAKHFLNDIIMKPKLSLVEMRFSIHVSMGQCQRARVEARNLLEGKLEEHYARVWDYAAALLQSNPGSTCKVGVHVNPGGVNYFRRFYVCFKNFKDGWIRGCRRVIGLDGCFLKGHVKGELLTAIGRDADNHVYPIAWEVVDVENIDNWNWFLELLVDDLDLGSGNGLVVISDQHTGLLGAVSQQLPYVEHRQCARHIFANFRKRYTGLELKNLFWEAAKSTVEGDFLVVMEKIRTITKAGYLQLMKRKPHTSCRAYFSPGFSCDALEKGISESFNSMIIHMRKKTFDHYARGN
ncbi:hypothetical protein LXL04_007352 [Taraxacum kok-saghyz]